MSKTALCIGINDYPGTQMDLRGCVNDANDWAALLESRGYTVTKLLDSQASLQALREGFKAIIGAAGSGDTVVITYSGHGTYAPDDNGDEADGLDEALCPWDITTAGALIDDEIHEIFAARKKGVRLVLVSDSCHSGTVTRAAPADPESADAPRAKFLPMGNWLPADKMPKGLGTRGLGSIAASAGPSPLSAAMLRRADDLLLSGCQEGPNNFSYDATIAGRPTGAFTYYALKALAKLPARATYAQWQKAVNPMFLPSASYPQSPQIVGSATARKRVVFE